MALPSGYTIALYYCYVDGLIVSSPHIYTRACSEEALGAYTHVSIFASFQMDKCPLAHACGRSFYCFRTLGNLLPYRLFAGFLVIRPPVL